MKKWILKLFVCQAVILVSFPLRGQEKQSLDYHTSTDPHPLAAGLASKTLDLTSEPPSGLELPDFKSEGPLFSKWLSPTAPNGSLWIALDRTSKQGIYDRLFIDSNGDGLLKDEAVVFAHSSYRSLAYFGPVKVALKGDQGDITYHLDLEFALQGDGPRLHVRSGGWYEGDITVGENQKHCVLMDQNATGTFDDRSIDFQDCDLIQIGKEGDPDICLVGNFIQVDDGLYRLEVDRDGTHVTLAPAKDVKFGTVKQQEDMTELVAGGENGMLTIKLERGVGKLPLGKYRVYGWVIERKDEKDNDWALKAQSSGNPGAFEVSEGHETVLALGEPIISSISVDKSGREFEIYQRLEGKSGEQIKLYQNGVQLLTRMQPAKVHIQNADGSYDRTFTLSGG